MSDATTLETTTVPDGLGRGVAHRARSQSVLGQHWSPAGLVGAVGRASVGFGLAVGRSRSIRPTVRFDDLNSAALRPSLDVWRQHRSGSDTADGADVAGDAAHTGHPSAPASDRRAPHRRAPGATRVAPQGPIERTRRRAPRGARPTWTDQIIQRSSIGFVTSAPGSAVPVSAIPADFVATGDPKLDQLRLLMRQRDQDAGRDAGASDVDRSAVGRLSDAARPRGERTQVRRTTAPEPTVSGGLDGPGRLARALRPESALTPTVPTPRLGGSPAPSSSTNRAPGTSPDIPTVRRSTRPTTPTTPATPMTPGRPAARTRRAAEPTRVDRLRAALIEHGILDVGAAETGEPPSSGNRHAAPDADNSRSDAARPAVDVDRPPVNVDRSDGRRSTSTSADLQRAAAGEGRRTTSDAAPRAARPSSPTAPGSTPVPSGSAPVSSSAVTSTIDPSTSPAVATAEPGAAAAGTVALAERTSPPAPAQDPASPGSASPGPAPVTSRPAHQLRAQRLLRTGLAPETAAGSSASVITTLGDHQSGQRAGLDTVVEAVTTTSAIDQIAAPAVPTLAVRNRPRRVRAAPALARVDSSPATVVRRVTLPRALSRTHRPVPRRLMADVRDVPGTAPRRLERASTVSLADAQTATRAVSSPTFAADVAQEQPRSPSTVPTTASPLLDVVRRLSTAAPTAVPPRSAGVVDTVDAARTADTTAVREQNPDAAQATAASAVTRRPGSDRTAADVAGSAAFDGPAADRRTQRPAERVAEQFMSVLSETIRRSPAPLPTTYRPLADAIAGPRPVMLSTDAASRKALRSVGKVAATTGDTIHLDRQAVSAARLDEVMAHELTHIAHPSPAPRFFDDLDDSPEERRAEQVARVMARSPLAPSATTSAPPVRRRSDERTIRRSIDNSTRQPTAPSGPGTVSAGALAASLTRTAGSHGGSHGGSDGVVQRWNTATPTEAPKPRPTLGSHRSSAPTSSESTRSAPEPKDVFGSERSAEWFRQQLDANMQRVVRQLEDRMIVELERRGGRTWRNS